MDEKHPPANPPTILTPLLLFLSAHAGIHSSTSPLRDPLDEHTIQYRGKSNVEYLTRDARLIRFLCTLGEFSICQKMTYACIAATVTFHVSERTGCSPYDTLRNGVIAILLTVALFAPLRFYAKRRRQTAIPPESEPMSYQSRLVGAMMEYGVGFADVGWEREALEKSRSKEREMGLKERFVVYGLEVEKGSEGALGVDVLVRFYVNGGVVFKDLRDVGRKPGVVVSRV